MGRKEYTLLCILTVTPQLFIDVFIGFVLAVLHFSTRMGHLQALYAYNVEELLMSCCNKYLCGDLFYLAFVIVIEQS